MHHARAVLFRQTGRGPLGQAQVFCSLGQRVDAAGHIVIRWFHVGTPS